MSIFQQLKLKNRHGLTLIELIVAMTLGLLLIGSLYAVYVTSYKAYKNSVGKAELNQNARIAMERISRDLRQTERITTSLPPDNSDPLNPPSNEIQFQDGHETSQIQYIKYSLTDSNLYRSVIHYFFSSDPATWVAWNAQDQYGNPPQESVDEETIRADKITSLQFYGEKLITIDLTATDGESTYHYRTKTLGRNIQ